MGWVTLIWYLFWKLHTFFFFFFLMGFACFLACFHSAPMFLLWFIYSPAFMLEGLFDMLIHILTLQTWGLYIVCLMGLCLAQKPGLCLLNLCCRIEFNRLYSHFPNERAVYFWFPSVTLSTHLLLSSVFATAQCTGRMAMTLEMT